MTTQRLVRGSKARIIAGLCIVVFCVAFLVLFQKTQTQLDNVNKNYEICVQQQESLSTQLQVIVDYKTRLEKSLQVEKSEHKQTRSELESRINDEKSRRDKTSMEANIRFQTLQQHYKLLQTKHEDLKEKSDKLQQQYLDDISKLKLKLKEQDEQLQQAEKTKEKSLEHLKTLYMQLQTDKENLAKQLENSKADHAKWQNDLNHLTKINHQLLLKVERQKNKEPNFQFHEDNIAISQRRNIASTFTRNFSKQVEIAKDVYQIRDKDDKPLEDKEESDIPQIDTPNKVEPEQKAQNPVLQKPSSPSKSTPKTKSSSQGNIENARPLLLPTVTPSNKNNSKQEISNDFKLNSINVLQPPNQIPYKKLPPGVVPVPKQELQKPEEQQVKVEKADDKIPEEINLALPNRYRNNIIESELAKEIIKEAKAEVKPLNPISIQNEPEVNMGIDGNQQDNAAMEVIDQPKNLVQEDPLHLMDVNPNAVDADDVKVKDLEHVIKDPVVQLLENKKSKKQHIDTLRLGGNGENGAIRAPPGGALYENEGDYDKEGQKEDLQIEEADPEGEEDDDGDDYDGHLAARQKEPAVRN